MLRFQLCVCVCVCCQQSVVSTFIMPNGLQSIMYVICISHATTYLVHIVFSNGNDGV